jgi:hypothetical protein
MYKILEMQTDANGHTAFLPIVEKATRPETESAYYMKCGAACISTVPIHTIMTFTEEGVLVKELTKCFKHQ